MENQVLAAVDDALAGFRQGLRADGYDLNIALDDQDVLHVEVLALENACEDCLIPKATLTGMISVAVQDVPGVRGVDLVYPGE